MSEITKEYIKMCREAKEIQEGWEPRIGDRYLVGNSIDLVVSTDFSCNPTPIDEYFKDDVWLPRQEDIIQIIINNGKLDDEDPKIESNLIYLLNRWLNFMVRSNPEYYGIFASNLNLMWLCFLMWKCFRKEWDGNAWEVI